MRKWLIAGAALVLTAAVTVTVWAFTRSDDVRYTFTHDDPSRPSYQAFTTMRQAVLTTCHADPNRWIHEPGDPWPPKIGPIYLTGGDGLPVIWTERGPKSRRWIATIETTEDQTYRVLDCKVAGAGHPR